MGKRKTHEEYVSEVAAVNPNVEVVGKYIKSHTKIEHKCKVCGHTWMIAPTKILCGRQCPRCNDGVSFPNKFLYSMLNQLNINYVPEYSPAWSQLKRYDIYIPSYNCIIENHGMQHYQKCTGNFSKISLEDEQENDIFKKHVAFENGIQYYIILDCRYSTLEWIMGNIIDNKLLDILNVNPDIIDWKLCLAESCKSYIFLASNCWNNGMSTSKIAKELKVSQSTVLSYLRKAVQLNICNYNIKESKQRGYAILSNKQRHQSEMTRKKNSEAHKGINNYFFGKRYTGKDSPNARRVIRLIDKKIFCSLSDAACDMQITSGAIGNRCRAKKSFMYYDEWLKKQET